MADQARVVVIGSINMDVVVTVPRLPLPGETLAGTSVHHVPGGKGANQAVAARRLGAPTALVGAVGDDAFGRQLAGFLAAEGIDTSGVRTVAGASGTALITVAADGENTVVVAAGANAEVGQQRVADARLRAGDVVLLQGEIPAETNEAAARAARAAGARTVLNLAPLRPPGAALLATVDLLVVNETEFAQLTGRTADELALARPGELTSADGAPLGDVVVTRGARGVVARIGGEPVAVPGRRVRVVDTTGAGDCFCGALAAALVAGAAPAAALERANAAAALSVGRLGAGPSMPTVAELADALAPG